MEYILIIVSQSELANNKCQGNNHTIAIQKQIQTTMQFQQNLSSNITVSHTKINGNLFFCEIYKREIIPKGQSKMDNPEKLATQSTRNEENKTKTQHNMGWAPLCANTHN